MPTCFVILGTPRSGTSCLGGVLARLGIDMGPEDIPANGMNPLGFYQDYELERLLRDACEAVEFIPEKIDLTREYRRRLAELVKRRCARDVDWGVKSSKLAHVFGEFLRSCTHEVKLLVTVRDPELSISSMADWIDEGHQSARSMIARSLSLIDEIRVTCTLPTLEVDYHDLVADPVTVVAKVATFCGRPLREEAVKFPTADLLRHTKIRGRSEVDEAKLLASEILEAPDKELLLQRLSLLAVRHTKGDRTEVLQRLRSNDHDDWKTRRELMTRK